jgi:hypothetical protein
MKLHAHLFILQNWSNEFAIKNSNVPKFKIGKGAVYIEIAWTPKNGTTLANICYAEIYSEFLRMFMN